MEDKLARYEKLEEEGRLFVLPCKIGTPIYHEGLINCKDCPHGAEQTYNDGYTDLYGDLYADDCDYPCPIVVRNRPFDFGMLVENGVLLDGYFLSKEEAEHYINKQEVEIITDEQETSR